MAKKLVAVTEIRHDDLVIPAGETLDASKFEKSQLEALYDAGAVRVDDGQQETTNTGPSAEEVEKLRAEADEANRKELEKNSKQQQLHAEQNRISADDSAAASSPAGEPKSPAKSASAPAVKETTNAKGNTK